MMFPRAYIRLAYNCSMPQHLALFLLQANKTSPCYIPPWIKQWGGRTLPLFFVGTETFSNMAQPKSAHASPHEFVQSVKHSRGRPLKPIPRIKPCVNKTSQRTWTRQKQRDTNFLHICFCTLFHRSGTGGMEPAPPRALHASSRHRKSSGPRVSWNHFKTKEVISLNNMDTSDCSWSTLNMVLDYMPDTSNMSLCLSSHLNKLFRETLYKIPASQKWISV